MVRKEDFVNNLNENFNMEGQKQNKSLLLICNKKLKKAFEYGFTIFQGIRIQNKFFLHH